MTMIAALWACCLSSCVYDNVPDNPADYNPQGVFVVLNVNPLSLNGPEIGNSHEKIMSLRVIMLSDGALEVNQKVSMTAVEASQLSRSFTFNTLPGTKEFFLIANEEKITNFSFEPETGIEVDGSTNFATLLAGFRPEPQGSNTVGTRLKAILENVCFEPDFTADLNGDYYLPYTSHYYGYNIGEDDQTYWHDPIKMYLVPVATKFIFRFINNRPNDVEISNIEIKNFNNIDFLTARLNQKEEHKYFGSEKLYWVDWLAKVSEESHKNVEYTDNENFNLEYGWINGYSMPSISSTAPKSFLEGGQIRTVKAAITEPDESELGYKVIEPGILTMGPFYMPESWNEFKYYDNKLEEEVTIQQYTLTLGLHDITTDPSKDPPFNNVSIGNLKSLFRNTCVIITVRMDAGKLEIYAEMADWNKRYAQGYVTTGKP